MGSFGFIVKFIDYIFIIISTPFSSAENNKFGFSFKLKERININFPVYKQICEQRLKINATHLHLENKLMK